MANNNEELISSMIDTSSIQKEIDFTVNELTRLLDTFQKINSLKLTLNKSTGLTDIIAVSKEVKTNFDVMTKSLGDLAASGASLTKQNAATTKGIKEQSAAVIENEKARQQQLKTGQEVVKSLILEDKAEQEQLKTKKLKQQATDTQNKLSQQEAKQAVDLSNDYLQLSKAYNDSALKAKNYALTLGEQHPITQQAIKDAQGMYAILARVDASVGQYGRNVGNYKSAFNGLGVSVAQVARELPSLTVSAQQFFLAISNNLPMVADEIARAKVEIAALKAEGQETPSLFQRIGSALVSWQTILAIGITVLTAYGAKLIDWIRSMFNAGDATERASKQLEEYVRQANAAKDSITQFNNELQNMQKLVNINNQIRFFGNDAQTNLTETRNNLGFVISAYDELNKKVDESIPRTNAAFESLGRIAAANKDDSELLQQFGDDYEAVYDQLSDTTKKAYDNFKKVEQAQFELQDQQKQKLNDLLVARRQVELAQKQFDQDALERQKKLNEELANKSFEDAKAILENEIEKNKKIVESDDGLYKFRAEAAHTSFELVNRLINLELQHRKISATEAKIAIEKNEEELNENLKKIFFDRQNFEKKFGQDPATPAPTDDRQTRADLQAANIRAQFLKISLNNDREYTERSQQLYEDLKNGKIKTFEDYNKAKQALDNEYQRRDLSNQIAEDEAIIDAMKALGFNTTELQKKLNDEKRKLYGADAQNYKGSLQEKLDYEKRYQDQLKQSYAQLRDEIISLFQTIGDAGFENRKNQIQAQIDLLDQQAAKEIEVANQTITNEQDKAARIIAIQASANAQKTVLEQQQKQQDIKKARFDKAVAILRIVENTAIAIAKAIAEFPLTAGQPFASIDAVLGAIQIATVLAQPIPTYRYGTKDHPGGPAMVGEAGKKEIAITPDGKAYVTPASATVVNLPKHTIVLPDADKYTKTLFNNSFKPVPAFDKSKTLIDNHAYMVEMTTRLEKKLIEVKSTIANKREYHFTVTPFGLLTQIREMNDEINYLNDHLHF